jgi:hypothetical protein
MNKEQAVSYLRFSGFSDEQIKAIEGAFSCPSAGVDCEDCPAYEDAISRYQKIKQMLYEFKEMPLAPCLMKGHICAVHEILNEVIEPSASSSEKPKSEWEHDHEILKAYSDGASAVLESIKYLIEQYEHYLALLEDDMKDGSATIVTKTKYAVYTEVVKQLKELLESEVQS